MARPIKETPILYGEDARRFLARMNEKRTISPEERAEMDAAYEMGMEMMRRGEEEKRLYRERQRLLKLQAQIQDFQRPYINIRLRQQDKVQQI